MQPTDLSVKKKTTNHPQDHLCSPETFIAGLQNNAERVGELESKDHMHCSGGI